MDDDKDCKAVPGKATPLSKLCKRYIDGFENIREGISRPDSKWSGSYPGADDAGLRIARHLAVDGEITFIPEEPGSKTSGRAAAGVVLLLLGLMAVGAAFGFLSSVEEFPMAAWIPMAAGGGVAAVMGIILLGSHMARTRQERAETTVDGIYLFRDALVIRSSDTARIFPRECIAEVAVEKAILGGSNAVGGPGQARVFPRSCLRIRKPDGSTEKEVLDLYPYAMSDAPPMNSILLQWLDG
ncbi:MAG: hypothetical protein ACYTFG_00865 [Planctomycetota bacterium]|jgi:hypothetical protein